MRRIIDAAGQLVDGYHGVSFALDYLPDEQGLPSFVSCGEPVHTQQMVAKHCANACAVVTNALADVLIANAYPRDHDFWRTFKSIPNVRLTVRPDGPILCFGRCHAGFNGVKPLRWPLSARRTRQVLRLVGPENLAALLGKILPRMAGDDAFFARLAAQTLNRNPVLVVSPTLVREGLTFPGLQVYETPQQAVEAAAALLPDRPQRVAAFPLSGMSYPVRTHGRQLGVE
jgi:hypothetical protein